MSQAFASCAAKPDSIIKQNRDGHNPVSYALHPIACLTLLRLHIAPPAPVLHYHAPSPHSPNTTSLVAFTSNVKFARLVHSSSANNFPPFVDCPEGQLLSASLVGAAAASLFTGDPIIMTVSRA